MKLQKLENSESVNGPLVSVVMDGIGLGCGDEGDAAYAALFLCAAYGGLSGLIFVLYSVFSRVKFIQLAAMGSGDDGGKSD